MKTIYIRATVADDDDEHNVEASIRNVLASAYLISDITDEAKRILRADYYADVCRIADEFAEHWTFDANDSEHFESRDEALEWLHETIDGSQRVIYTSQAQMGLLFSDNDGAYLENFGTDGAVTDGALNWSALMYAALEQDVYEDLSSRLDIDVNDEPEDEDGDDA